MLPDISSPGGFLLGVLGLVGVVALVYALYRSIGSLFVRSKGTYKLAHELSRIANALELLARQRQEASEGELHPDAPLNIPTPVHRPDEVEQEQPKGEAKNSGTLEVIATPGHTPDAISLFDHTNGLLFTGDTYYPAPIWLFRPETNLDAYAASIRRLAALAPQVTVVLGAHNVPVASPTVLPRLVAAFDAVRAGKIHPSPDSPGKVLYKVDDISFLMREPGAH